jgi:hypothetical protein
MARGMQDIENILDTLLDIHSDGRVLVKQTSVPINTTTGQGVVSSPPAGMFSVKNVFVDTHGKFVYQYDDSSNLGGAVESNPPLGAFRVVNLYADSDGKLVADYENNQ